MWRQVQILFNSRSICSALSCSQWFNIDFYLEKSVFACNITSTINIYFFSVTSMSPALTAPSASSCSRSLSLLWTYQSEHERNIISKQVVFLIFRNGLITLSDLNCNDYYIKKHWLISGTTDTSVFWLVLVFSLLSAFFSSSLRLPCFMFSFWKILCNRDIIGSWVCMRAPLFISRWMCGLLAFQVNKLWWLMLVTSDFPTVSVLAQNEILRLTLSGWTEVLLLLWCYGFNNRWEH